MRSNSLPQLNFGLDPMLEEMRDMVGRWVDDKLLPRAAEIDEKNEFPRDLWPELGEMGLLGLTVDEEFGGTGLTPSSAAVFESIGGTGFIEC